MVWPPKPKEGRKERMIEGRKGKGRKEKKEEKKENRKERRKEGRKMDGWKEGH